MDTVFSVLAGLGLAAACGFRVFVPLLVTSLAAHTGHLELSPGFAWIGSNTALIAFAVATLVEIAAYYVPWLDHLLDTLASPASAVAGTILMAAFATDFDPFARWTLAIIAGGGVAATVQAGTVALRGLSFSLTGGLSNPLVSTGELGGALATSAMAVTAPAAAAMGLAGLGVVLATRCYRRRQASLR